MGIHSYFTLHKEDGSFIVDCGFRYLEKPLDQYLYDEGSENMAPLAEAIDPSFDEPLFTTAQVRKALLILKEYVEKNSESLRILPSWQGRKSVTPENALLAISQFMRALEPLDDSLLIEVFDRIEE